MYQILIKVFSVLLMIWLFRRILSVLFRASKKPEPAENSVNKAQHMVKDPVCGMYMDSRLAVRMERDNEAYYFCSEDCKNKYLNRSSGDGMSSATAE